MLIAAALWLLLAAFARTRDANDVTYTSIGVAALLVAYDLTPSLWFGFGAVAALLIAGLVRSLLRTT